MSVVEKILRFCPELERAGFDMAVLGEMMEVRFLDDFTVFAAAAGIFLESYESQLNEIRSAIVSEDRKKTYAAIHRFKGAIANFHDAKIVETAAVLEVGTQDWARERLEAQYAILATQSKEFVKRLRMLVDSFRKIQESV